MEKAKRFLHFASLRFGRYDLAAVVVATSLAHSVGQLHLAALRALGHAGQRELPVRATTLVAAGFRNFSLRYCHGGYTSYSFFYYLANVKLGLLVPIGIEQRAQRGKTRIHLTAFAVALGHVSVSTAMGTKTLAVLRAEVGHFHL